MPLDQLLHLLYLAGAIVRDSFHARRLARQNRRWRAVAVRVHARRWIDE